MEDPHPSFVLENLITEIKMELGFSDPLKNEALENDALALELGTAKVELQGSADFEVSGEEGEAQTDDEREPDAVNDDSQTVMQVGPLKACDGVWKCELCSKQYSRKRGLTLHMRLHDSRKLYQCSVCDKIFSNNWHLTKHTMVHTGEKPYQCNVCEKRFLQKSHFTVHMNTHTRTKLYLCSICDKHFLWKNSFAAHMRCHSGERPYQCTLCSVKFGVKSSLLRHVKTHAAEKNSKSEADGNLFNCEVCKMRFTEKQTLDGHVMKFHIEEATFIGSAEICFTCDYCHKTFGLLTTLRSHLQKHLELDSEGLVSRNTEDPFALHFPESTVETKMEQYLPDPLKLEV